MCSFRTSRVEAGDRAAVEAHVRADERVTSLITLGVIGIRMPYEVDWTIPDDGSW